MVSAYACRRAKTDLFMPPAASRSGAAKSACHAACRQAGGVAVVRVFSVRPMPTPAPRRCCGSGVEIATGRRNREASAVPTVVSEPENGAPAGTQQRLPKEYRPAGRHRKIPVSPCR